MTSPARDAQDLHDLISDAIGDSMDMDWTYSDGAKAIIRAFEREGLVVMQSDASNPVSDAPEHISPARDDAQVGDILRHKDGRTGAFASVETDGRFRVQSLRGKGFWVFAPEDIVTSPARDDAQVDERALKTRIFTPAGADAHAGAMDALHRFAQLTACPPGHDVIGYFSHMTDVWQDVCQREYRRKQAAQPDASQPGTDERSEGVNT